MKKKKLASSYAGLQEGVRSLATPLIEVWENKYSDKRYMIHVEIPEFTCICPKTGLPDFATITIDYIPDKSCVELKSLKLYMNFFRDVGIFHEHLTNKIFEDFLKAVHPVYAKIVTRFNPRGGIVTMVSREYRKAKKAAQ